MRTFLIISLLSLFTLSSFGQNLIPNGDFELGPDSMSIEWDIWIDNTCAYADTIGGPDFWTVTTGTPDRLVEGDIPCNWDDDTAQSGSAYAVFGQWSTGEKEAGKATLISPMQKDSLYYLSFYAQLELLRGFGTYKPIKIAIKFNNGLDSITFPDIIDTLNWLQYDTLFIASANATEIEVIAIGIGLVGPEENGTKFDNIRLEKMPLTGITLLNKEQKIKIYPNPTTGHFTVQGTATEIQVYDLFGRLVLRTKKEQVDMSSYPAGIYMVRLVLSEAEGAGEAVRKLILH